MVMASWPAAGGRDRRPLPAESVRRRVNAAMRRAVRQAISYGMPLIAVGLAADAVLLLVRFGPAARPSAALDAVAAAVTAVIGTLVVRRGRRPEPAAYAILLILYGVALINGRLLVDAAAVTAGYGALVLVGSALFLAWTPRWHASWLAVAVGLSAVQLLTAPSGREGQAASQLIVTVVAAFVSAIGQPLAFQRTQRMLVERFELRRLTNLA
ncbi:MAG TPA: hypothetical protein VFK61_02680, partial [Candidatus Limnocylindria bacterium]|nr:hypothetical protein [Candidatus Limnocylindria bacterium]